MLLALLVSYHLMLAMLFLDQLLLPCWFQTNCHLSCWIQAYILYLLPCWFQAYIPAALLDSDRMPLTLLDSGLYTVPTALLISDLYASCLVGFRPYATYLVGFRPIYFTYCLADFRPICQLPCWFQANIPSELMVSGLGLYCLLCFQSKKVKIPTDFRPICLLVLGLYAYIMSVSGLYSCSLVLFYMLAMPILPIFFC
jgi:hypothetical protein